MPIWTLLLVAQALAEALNWYQIAREFGFPVVCVAGLAWFVYQLIKRQNQQVDSQINRNEAQTTALTNLSESFRDLAKTGDEFHDIARDRNKLIDALTESVEHCSKNSSARHEVFLRAAEKACDLIEDLAHRMGHDVTKGVESIRSELRRNTP